MGELTSREFRDVMGCFATGVTVVTAAAGDVRRGMTANAFSSVSLEPPLLLVCVARTSSMFPVVEATDTFAVNILAEDQQALSTQFAKDGDFSHWEGARFREVLGVPVLEDVVAYAVCRVHARQDGGDHVLLLGEVIEGGTPRREAQPLLFFQGQYREIGAVGAR